MAMGWSVKKYTPGGYFGDKKAIKDDVYQARTRSATQKKDGLVYRQARIKENYQEQ